MRTEGAKASLGSGTSSPIETDPIVLVLPACRKNIVPETPEDNAPVLEQLHAIETGSTPKVELAWLTQLLARSPGLALGLSDPHEGHNYHHPLASVNAYKHRLHALRREFVTTRLRTVELEMQLTEARARVQRLENHVQFLEQTLHHMRSSRAWQWTERCSRWRQTLLRWLGR